MSTCSTGSSGNRRRATAIAASVAGIAASTPLLLRHSLPSDWSDSMLAGILGFAIGLGLTIWAISLYRSRSAG